MIGFKRQKTPICLSKKDKSGLANYKKWGLEQEKAELTIIYYQLNEFKRPQARLNNYKHFFDYSSPNKLKFNLQIDEVPYRFIYL